MFNLWKCIGQSTSVQKWCFCLLCISKALEIHKQCPTCKSYLYLDRLSFNVIAHNIIARFNVKCPVSYCIWSGTVSQFRDHTTCFRPVHTYDNGDTYEGERKNGKNHGNDVYRYSDGDVFSGRFEQNRKHANGDCYVGDFRNNKKHGRGRFRSADGSFHFTEE